MHALSSCFEFLSDSDDFEIAYASIEKMSQTDIVSYDFFIMLAFYAAKKGKTHIIEKLIQLAKLNSRQESIIRQTHKTLINNDFTSNLDIVYPEICKSPPNEDDIEFYIYAKRIDLALEILQDITDPESRRSCIIAIKLHKGSYSGQIPRV